MYSGLDDIRQGDDYSVGAALLDDGHDLERRCQSVEKVVLEKIFSLDQALSLYEVNHAQFAAYLLLHYSKENKKALNFRASSGRIAVPDQTFIFLALIASIAELFSSADLSNENKRLVSSMQEALAHSH